MPRFWRIATPTHLPRRRWGFRGMRIEPETTEASRGSDGRHRTSHLPCLRARRTTWNRELLTMSSLTSVNLLRAAASTRHRKTRRHSMGARHFNRATLPGSPCSCVYWHRPRAGRYPIRPATARCCSIRSDALCHTPSLRTSSNPIAALSNVTANLFSDLLVHNMGAGLADGVTQGAASGNEFRTAPLWGVGQRLFFMHDGRTSDLLTAIGAHDSSGSEAHGVISKFNSLTFQQKQDLLIFLRSL